MSRDRIERLIEDKIRQAFDEAHAQREAPMDPFPIDPDEEERRVLRSILSANVQKWDDTIATAITSGAESVLLMRTAGTTWFQTNSGRRRGSWKHRSTGSKYHPLFENIGLDIRIHGLHRLRKHLLPTLTEWLNENYWSAVWVEHYERVDRGLPWNDSMSSVQEIHETLTLRWI